MSPNVNLALLCCKVADLATTVRWFAAGVVREVVPIIGNDKRPNTKTAPITADPQNL
jgi:hypothetical protein